MTVNPECGRNGAANGAANQPTRCPREARRPQRPRVRRFISMAVTQCKYWLRLGFGLCQITPPFRGFGF
jgi:hypothetical protein